jgi:energy-coupling factor transport system substrate-specific component
MLDRIKSNFNTQTWVLIPIAIAINIAVGQIVLLLKLPVYLDSIGTVLVAVLCGPWAGALTGALSNIIWGIAIDPGALPWWPVAFFIGYIAGRMAEWGFFKSWWKVVVTGFVIALTATIVGTPIAVYLFGGITASGSSSIILGLPKRTVGGYPKAANAEAEGADKNQLYVAIGVVVLLVLFAAFMLRNVLGG